MEFLLPYQNESVHYDDATSKKEEVWTKIYEALQESHIVVCSGRNKDSDIRVANEEKVVNNIGLITNH